MLIWIGWIFRVLFLMALPMEKRVFIAKCECWYSGDCVPIAVWHGAWSASSSPLLWFPSFQSADWICLLDCACGNPCAGSLLATISHSVSLWFTVMPFGGKGSSSLYIHRAPPLKYLIYLKCQTTIMISPWFSCSYHWQKFNFQHCSSPHRPIPFSRLARLISHKYSQRLHAAYTV